ncbi:MAG: chromosome segregation SMC family protein [candidate division WOR-3 bacterium]
MKIKSILLHGFKSFYEREEIIFSDKISLVIGPNGCGKTNIFEAIRFVLGESRLNKLRVRELKELIFAGNKEKKALPYAEVTIVLKNDKGESKFTRRVYRDNSQEFFLNDDRISEKHYKEEIESIFGKKSYSHFQWEDVEELIRKPKERIKEMILEACELFDFDHKKKVMERRLEKAEREIKAFEIVIKDKEERIKKLEEERKRALRYRSLQEILKEKKLLLVKAEYSKLLKDKAKKEKELKEDEEFFKKLEEEIFILKKEIEEIKSERENLSKEEELLKSLKIPLESKREKILSELNRKYGEFSGLKDRENYLKLLIEERKKEIEKLKEVLRDKIAYEEIDETSLEKTEREFFEISKKVREIEGEFLKLNIKNDELNMRLNNILKREEDLKIEMIEMENKKKIKENEIENLKKEREKLESIYIEIEKKYEEHLKEEKFLTSTIDKIEREINILEGELLKLKSAREVDENLLPELSFLSSYIDFSKEDKFIYVIDDLLEAKILNNENINGIEKFLEKGGKIIIEREEFKGEMPLFLKRKEGIGDLLNTRFLNFKVFKNFKEGITAWKNKECDYMVTEDGFVITKDGVLRKIFTQKIEKNKRITEIEKMLPEKKRNLKENKDKLESLKKIIEKILKERENIKENLFKLNLKINEINSEINFLSLNLKKQKDGLDKIKMDSEEIKREKEKVLFKIKEREKELKGLKDKEENFSKKINEINLIREKLKELKNAREKVEIYEKSLKEREEELIDVKERMKNLEEDLKKLESERKKIEEELFEINKRESELEEKIKSINDKYEEKRNIYHIKENSIDKISDKIIKLKQEIDEIEKNLEFYPDNIEFIPDNISIKKIKEEIEEIEREIYSMHDVNLLADEEYKILEKDYFEKIDAYKDLKDSIDKLKESIRIMEERGKLQYTEFLGLFKEELKNVSSVLMGGEIKIKPLDEKNILESELLIDVSPSGKKVRSVLLLSGGERSLFALTVLFTLAKLSPSVLFALDEVDAALDDANTLRFRSYVEKLSESSQVLIITHNKRTMEIANRVYGITMENGVSKIYGIKFED